MTIKDFLADADAEVQTILASGFKIEVVETAVVPSFADPAITYDNLDAQVKRCKLLESCVLYVDIRNSAAISAERQAATLARMYSAFVRMMIKSARHFGGHVRNIIGDRVMVVFDKQDCFVNAVRTAMLCQTVAQKIIDRRITTFDFKCGVGIDHGKMLIVKAGAIRRGDEMEFYRSLVWLGRPANVASKLTDVASKARVIASGGYVRVGFYYPYTKVWRWSDKSYMDFSREIEPSPGGKLTYKDEHYETFFEMEPRSTTVYNAPILITKAVYDGYAAAVGAETVRREGWASQAIFVSGYTGAVYGSSAVYPYTP